MTALRTVETGTEHLHARVEGRVGRITLDRPKALNALTMPMLHGMHRALRAWLHDDAVRTVVLDSTASPRAFCAGGDIVAVRDSALGDHRLARALWRHEYTLDLRLARYPKPVVSFLDGLVLGGGVGIGAHRPVRVVTATTQLAMPEVAIGLAPDVGGLYLLARLPDELGTHAALTGARLDAATLLRVGLAEAFVPTDHLPDLLDRLRTTDAAVAVAAAATTPPDAAPTPAWIPRCFTGDDAEEIVRRLRAEAEPAAHAAADTMESGSPIALAVTLAGLRRAAAMTDLAQCLRQDYALSCAFLAGPDLPEGIRATVVDKDRTPRWSVTGLAAVSAAQVASYFTDDR
ncbi:enoyl-CoA hydratase [Jatrophihabitans endophyticus]|uniref:3-hydroxyisobutyryl-CoA hydrolase n=1 Tax=Jatrophihabitans endophyticus TaxID=1206085 RepID=A0A1M5Q370_9ACTN|nr:enoyl-CoA hydratase/isomerase family protein [Jatrophihabitans endophyticus]SHH08422.1 enoyl-CoA hydratase [Jatrophihabitans endophyticus]